MKFVMQFVMQFVMPILHWVLVLLNYSHLQVRHGIYTTDSYSHGIAARASWLTRVSADST